MTRCRWCGAELDSEDTTGSCERCDAAHRWASDLTDREWGETNIGER